MPFDGKVIETVTGEDGKPWISVRSVCQAIGIDVENQRRKLQADERFMCGAITAHDAIGRSQEMFCIPLEQLNGWLFSIQPGRVREDIRPNLIRYQRECFEVLYNHFMPNGVQDLQPLMDSITSLNQKFDSIHEDIRYFGSVTAAIFGDDKEEIESLILQVAKAYNVSGGGVWRYIQERDNIASYKRQNKLIINHLKALLDKGLKLVDSGNSASL